MATNVYGVESRRPDPDAQNAPDTMTYHGFSVEANGQVIGRISDWTPMPMARPAVHVRELNARTFGRPVDIVPGMDDGFTLSFSRSEVWNNELELAFGDTDVYTLLTDQTRPFIVRESFMRGNTVYRQWSYLGCWFTSKTMEAFSAEGNAIVKVSGEIMFVAKQRTR